MLLLLIASALAWRPNPSFGLTNFEDTTMAWCSNSDSANIKGYRPAGICQLRWSKNGYRQNLLTGDGFTFKIGTKKFTDPFKFVGSNTIDYPGEYTHTLLYYNLNTISKDVSITKRYMMTPKKHYVMEAYDITNTGSSTQTVSLLDFANSSVLPSNVKAGYFADSNSLYFDYSNDNQYGGVVVFGMQGAQSLSLGAAVGFTPVDYFHSNDVLDGNKNMVANAVIGAFQTKVTVAPGETKRVTVFKGLETSVSAASSLANQLSKTSYDVELAELKRFMDAKTAKYKKPSFANDGEKRMWYSSLFTLLFSQNPTLGTLLASYHPLYTYKTWTRDATFAAMILASIGETEGAEKALRWLSTAQLRDGGYFPTTYSWYTGEIIGFVEPQYDSIGAALTAYYYYYYLTKKADFLKETNVKNRIKQLEDFLMFRDYNNLVKPDYSIWEESSDGWSGNGLPTQYYAFTQIQCHHGLMCAALIEEKIYGDNNRANELRNRAADLAAGFDRCFWNDQQQYYVQSLWSDTKSQKVVIDGSTATMTMTDITTDTYRIKKQLDRIRSDITKLSYGIARYYNDPYFYKSKFNPAGQEAREASPPWGVATMFMSWAEMQADSFDQHAYMTPYRLKWMIDVTGPDYIPCGEAVDGVTGDPVMASMPDVYEHAGVYMLTLLQYQKLIPLFSYKYWN